MAHREKIKFNRLTLLDKAIEHNENRLLECSWVEESTDYTTSQTKAKRKFSPSFVLYGNKTKLEKDRDGKEEMRICKWYRSRSYWL